MDYKKIKKLSFVVYLAAGLLLTIEFFFPRFFKGYEILIYSISVSAMIFIEIMKYLSKRDG